MGENLRRQLHPDTDIYTVGHGRNIQILADFFHPLAATAANRHNAFVAFIAILSSGDGITLLPCLDFLHRSHKVEIHPLLQHSIQIFQHNIVLVGTQMTDRSIQQLQLVLHTGLLQTSTAGGIHLGASPSIGHVDFIHIIHELQGLFPANMLVEGTTKIIGNIVLAIREGTSTAKAIHNSTGWAVDATLDGSTINRAFTLFQGTASLKNSYLYILVLLYQLIGRKNTARPCTNNNYIVLHANTPHLATTFNSKEAFLRSKKAAKNCTPSPMGL